MSPWIRQRRLSVGFCLAVLSGVALALRIALDIDGVLDTDAINFGLAALKYDLLQHQPHPPGYPGYVLLLKLVHLLGPWLEPVEIAKWGSRLCGLATVPAAFWATGRVVRHQAPAGERESSWAEPGFPQRQMMAAAFAAVSPVLWYYGSDGQSHGGEALVILLLFGAVADARSRPYLSRTRLLLVVAAFGLGGSIRPTVVALGFPLLVWLLWRRPLWDWVLAAAVGLAVIAGWFVPVVLHTGGWDLYQRASNALFQLFTENLGILGKRTTGTAQLANIEVTLYGLIAWCPSWLWRARRGFRAGASWPSPRRW